MELFFVALLVVTLAVALGMGYPVAFAIPGSAILTFGLATLCDERLAGNERINFNAGDHAISISMPYADYVRVESPEIGPFAE